MTHFLLISTFVDWRESSVTFVRVLASGGVGLLIVGLPLGVVMMLLVNQRMNARQLALALGVLMFVDAAWTGYHWAEWRVPERWLSADAPLADTAADLSHGRRQQPGGSVLTGRDGRAGA